MEICVEQNYFLFNGYYYKQKEGLAMGSPLSPILAEIFMDHLEEKIFNSNHQYTKNIFYWFRYVDDILCCWIGTLRQLDQFLQFLNPLHDSINFTMETEVDNKLHFLNLTIEIREHKHIFSIHRKPTNTDQVIPADSVHPWPHKLAAFHALIHRLLSIPMSDNNFNGELHTIKLIATNNGCDDKLVENLLTIKRRKLAVSLSTTLSPQLTDEPRKWIKMLFIKQITYKIINNIPKDKFKIALYTQNSLTKHFCKTMDAIGEKKIRVGYMKSHVNAKQNTWAKQDEISTLDLVNIKSASTLQ
jgi:hypothetical protein